MLHILPKQAIFWVTIFPYPYPIFLYFTSIILYIFPFSLFFYFSLRYIFWNGYHSSYPFSFQETVSSKCQVDQHEFFIKCSEHCFEASDKWCSGDSDQNIQERFSTRHSTASTRNDTHDIHMKKNFHSYLLPWDRMIPLLRNSSQQMPEGGSSYPYLNPLSPHQTW